MKPAEAVAPTRPKARARCSGAVMSAVQAKIAVAVAEVTPPSMRPITSHHKVGASAISSQSKKSPAIEINMTGRRP